MPRVVAGCGEGRNSGRDLDLTVDVLETLEKRRDAPSDVRSLRLRARKRDGVTVCQVAGAQKENGALQVGIPTDVIDVQMRQEDDVDPVPRDAEAAERLGQLTLLLGGPVPQARRPHTRVDQHGDASGAHEVALARQAPAVAGEELRIQRAIGLPGFCSDFGEGIGVLGEQSHRVREGMELDRADYHCARSAWLSSGARLSRKPGSDPG